MAFDITDMHAALLHELKNNDRSLVEMALLNAIHNALAYVRLCIRIEADMQEDCLAFTIRDDSSGFPEPILSGGSEKARQRQQGHWPEPALCPADCRIARKPGPHGYTSPV